MDAMHSGSEAVQPGTSTFRHGRREIVSGPLSAHISHGGETSTIGLTGELDLATVEAVEMALREAVGRGPARIVIDMHELTFIDSTGIAFLVAAVREHGLDKLGFVQSDAPAVQRVFELVGLDRFIGDGD